MTAAGLILSVAPGGAFEKGAIQEGAGGSRVLTIAAKDGKVFGAAKFERLIAKGESLKDLVNEMKAGQWTAGEHAIATLDDGTRALVSGGKDGIQWALNAEGRAVVTVNGVERTVDRLIAHTHPPGAGATPSPEDLASIEVMGQRNSYITPVGGDAQKFTSKAADTGACGCK